MHEICANVQEMHKNARNIFRVFFVNFSKTILAFLQYFLLNVQAQMYVSNLKLLSKV